MSNETKCSCRNCGENIAFPSEAAGQTITCPHCQLETPLFIPLPAISPKLPAPARKAKTPAILVVSCILVAAIIIAAICLTQKLPKQANQTNQTNLKPVVGAFGWKLGDKFTGQFSSESEVDNLEHAFTPATEMPPFDDFLLEMTADKCIYGVKASGFAHNHGYNSDAFKKALISLLSEKYGLRPLSSVEQEFGVQPPGDNYDFGTVDQSVHLHIFENDLFALEYYDKKLRNIYYAEQEAKRKKDEADKKAALSKGL
jgi:hypothetical protein